MLAAPIGEGGGLFVGPPVSGMTPGPFRRPPFDGHQVAAGEEHPTNLSEPGVEVRPVVHGGERPEDRRGTVGEGDRFGGTFDVPHIPRSPREDSRDPQHDRRRIDPGDPGAQSSGVADRGARAAPHVHDRIAGPHAAQSYGEPGVALAAEDHGERRDRPPHPGKARVVRMVIGRSVQLVHTSTLTVEPDFKSSGSVSEPLLTIGDVASRARVATSTIRYYERIGLLTADARTSGQRRYRVGTLRKLVFIGMLQDAGLALGDIGGILDAADAAEWKAIVNRRLETLDTEIATLIRARSYLSGALLCRFDHPATGCSIMGAEIDRRLVGGRGAG